MDALRALDEERATDDALNGLVLQAGLDLARGGGAAHRSATTCCRSAPHYNVETVNGVLLRNAPVAAALFRAFAARFDPQRARRPRGGDGGSGGRGEAGPGGGAQPGRRRGAARRSTTSSAPPCARTSTSGPSGRWSRSRSTAARWRACRRRGRCSRSTSTRACWRASTCAGARSRAAASAGATATTTSAPRSWAS